MVKAPRHTTARAATASAIRPVISRSVVAGALFPFLKLSPFVSLARWEVEQSCTSAAIPAAATHLSMAAMASDMRASNVELGASNEMEDSEVHEVCSHTQASVLPYRETENNTFH